MIRSLPIPKTITLFLRVNNPDFGQMHLVKQHDEKAGLVLNDNLENSDINDPSNPVHNELIELVCTGLFERPPGSPTNIFRNLPKGSLVGVTINPITRVIFEIWLPDEKSLQRGCPGKPIWGF